MNRTIFGRKSGVLVDVCKLHGTWFDAQELEAVVAFVDAGGLELAERQAVMAALADKRASELALRTAAMDAALTTPTKHWLRGETSSETTAALVDIASVLFDL